MDNYSYEQHRRIRNEHEQQTTQYLKEYFKHYCTNHSVTITPNDDEWSHTDYTINIDGKEVLAETKVRNVFIEQYPTIAISSDKIEEVNGQLPADVIFFFYPASNSVGVITRKKILDNIDKIYKREISVTNYQYAGTGEKVMKDNYFIPVDMLEVYKLKMC